MTRGLLFAAMVVVAGCGREPTHITIGAAAVLRNVMPELVEQFQATHNTRIDVTYRASDALADELPRVAYDALLLAEQPRLAALARDGWVDPDSARAVASTTIVLVGASSSGLTFRKLGELPANSKIAIGDPASVPAGRYAESYLKAIDMWSIVEPKLIYGGDVAGVLALAARGNAVAAIVYRTDAARATPLVVLDAPVDAPRATIAAATATHASEPGAAREFLAFLSSSESAPIWVRHQFAAP